MKVIDLEVVDSSNVLNVADMMLISLLFERSECCTVSSTFDEGDVVGFIVALYPLLLMKEMWLVLLLHCILYF
jgi:hypothetical protein